MTCGKNESYYSCNNCTSESKWTQTGKAVSITFDAWKVAVIGKKTDLNNFDKN